MLEGGVDRRAQHIGQQVETWHVAPHDVDSERQRHAALVEPPLAEVERLLEPRGRVRELSLVDQEPGVRASGAHLVEDPVERHFAIGERAAECQSEHQEGRREPARDEDFRPPQLRERHQLARHDDRAVADPDRGPVREQDVTVLHERIGRERERRHFQLPA